MEDGQVTLVEESIAIAIEYVEYALASGLTTGEIVYSLGYPQTMWPTKEQTIQLVAFKWRMECAPVEMKRAA